MTVRTLPTPRPRRSGPVLRDLWPLVLPLALLVSMTLTTLGPARSAGTERPDMPAGPPASAEILAVQHG